MSKYTKITDGLPVMTDNSNGGISHSGLVSLGSTGKKAVNGFIQRYNVDFNAPHIGKKAGDMVFFNEQNEAVTGVSGWAVIDNK